jgi:hypothetical protein
MNDGGAVGIWNSVLAARKINCYLTEKSII